jgi:hypothetical protein
MTPKNKALAVALMGLWMMGAPVGCSSQVSSKPKQQVVHTEDGGEEEEDLTNLEDPDPERDEFGRPKEETQGLFVSIAYLTMTAASALLPFLMLI